MNRRKTDDYFGSFVTYFADNFLASIGNEVAGDVIGLQVDRTIGKNYLDLTKY